MKRVNVDIGFFVLVNEQKQEIPLTNEFSLLTHVEIIKWIGEYGPHYIYVTPSQVHSMEIIKNAPQRTIPFALYRIEI